MKTLRAAAGSVMVVGLSGLELTRLEGSWLRLIRPAGVILFRRNIQDARQTRALLAESMAHCVPHAMRCVDVEGGTVDRLRVALAGFPSAQAVSASGDERLMERHGALIAEAVKLFGFNTTLAPVLDLALPTSAAVMGTRTTSSNPTLVVRYVRAFLRGLEAHGIVGCGKHFPGLGGGALDSHLETPRIERSFAELWRSDLVPYRELARKLPMVMVNHAAYPRTRSGLAPATASPYWVTQVLTRRMDYRGLIFSDDLEMGGILKQLSMEEAGVAAIRAGIHTVEVCHSVEMILRCYEGLVREAERSRPFREMLLRRAAEAERLRRNRFDALSTRTATVKQVDAMRAKIQRFQQAIEKGRAK